MMTKRCSRCGGTRGFDLEAFTYGYFAPSEPTITVGCGCEAPPDAVEFPSPDLWDLMEHPERYDTESARRRSQTWR